MSNAIRRAVIALALYALGVLPGAPAQAATCLSCTCTVSVSPLAFGAFSPASTSALQASGMTPISCTTTLALSSETVMLSLSAGIIGTFAQRLMAGPGNATLRYNVYTDSGDSIIFGDGTTGTAMESATFALPLAGTTKAMVPYYAAIPAGNAGPSGSYSDSLTLTINY